MISARNAQQDLKRRADRRVTILDQIADLQEDMKQLKAEDKADGFNEKALAQAVKEMRRGIDFQADQLQLELEVDTYRKAVGLPRTLDDAQKRAHAAAEEVEPSRTPSRGKAKGKSNEPLH